VGTVVAAANDGRRLIAAAGPSAKGAPAKSWPQPSSLPSERQCQD